MAEHPHLIPDILERLPAVRQAGLEASARLIRLAVQSYFSWFGFNTDQLARDDLA